MRHAFVMLEDSRLAGAASRHLKPEFGDRVCGRSFPIPLEYDKLKDEAYWAGQVADHFTALADWIENEVSQNGGMSDLRDSLAVIDFVDPACGGWDDISLEDARAPRVTLAAMLITAFPEMHWVLHTPYLAHRVDWLGRFHDLNAQLEEGLARPIREGHVALFDASGLQDHLRGKTLDEPWRRRHWAAAIDEEPDFAFFSAYSLYRQGYRVACVTTYRSMCRLLETPPDLPPSVILEDHLLNFPDKPARREGDPGQLKRLFDLDEPISRADTFRAFGAGPGACGPQRVCVTGTNEGGIERPAGMLYVPKPIGDIHELLRSSGVGRVGPAEALAKLRADAGERSHHAAPGRILLRANRMLNRARYLLAEEVSPTNALHAATLALVARELLQGQTPTTSLEAIAIQHEAEVEAETLFIGVSHQHEVKSRLKEVAFDCKQVCRKLSHPDMAGINAQQEIVDHLAQMYRSHGLVDEELQCLSAARHLLAEAELARAKADLEPCRRLLNQWSRAADGWWRTHWRKPAGRRECVVELMGQVVLQVVDGIERRLANTARRGSCRHWAKALDGSEHVRSDADSAGSVCRSVRRGLSSFARYLAKKYVAQCLASGWTMLGWLAFWVGFFTAVDLAFSWGLPGNNVTPVPALLRAFTQTAMFATGSGSAPEHTTHLRVVVVAIAEGAWFLVHVGIFVSWALEKWSRR